MNVGKRKAIAVSMVLILVIAVVAVVVLSMSKNGFSATITDASGRSVSVDSEPQRIVSGAPAITEIVCGLGLSDKLVAVTEYDDYPAKAVELRDNGSVIGGFWTPSFEKIVSFHPDLVLLNSGVDSHQSLARQLEDANITVVMLYRQENLDEVYKSIELVGKITGTTAKATDIIDSMKAQTAEIGNKVSSAPKPNVLFVSYAEAEMSNMYAAGGNTAVDEIIRLSGGTNVLASKSGWYTPSNEEMMVLPQQIDCIVMTIMFSPESPENTTAFLKSDPLWKESPAVKNNDVYFLTGQAESIFNRQSLRMVDAVQLMAEILHPDSFTTKVPHSSSGVNLIGDEYTQYISDGTAAQSSSIAVAMVTRD